MTIITKQSLNAMLTAADEAKKVHIIGRALVALFERQTEAEKATDHTAVDNGIGFAGSDARSGSLTAKSYLKNKTLQQWQVDKWLKVGKNGYPRICKYAKQLNEVAERKAAVARAAVPEMTRKLEQLRVELGEVLDSDDPSIIDPLDREIKALEARINAVSAM